VTSDLAPPAKPRDHNQGGRRAARLFQVSSLKIEWVNSLPHNILQVNYLPSIF
jgi:hypothetical protein